MSFNEDKKMDTEDVLQIVNAESLMELILQCYVDAKERAVKQNQ